MRFKLLLIVPVMIVLSLVVLTACGNDDDDSSDDDDTDYDAVDDDDDDDTDDDDDDDDDDYTGDDDEPDWRFMVDDQGRTLVLHGTAVSNTSKRDGHPWVTRDDVLGISRDWGFNLVRYLIFWIKIEPEPGVYDDVYLDEVAERMDWFADAGLHVVLDMHQDLWGPSLNCLHAEIYNGAPEWATITDGLPYIPFCEWFGWAAGYMSPDNIRAFDNFFDYEGDHPELQDHYGAMWAYVAERFKDHPAILGYELMNEPWHGADLLNARKFDETKMHGFIQRMIDSIRAVDADSWIFFEPRAFGPNQGAPSYIPPLNDPRNGPRRLVYTPHIYPRSVDKNIYQTGAADVAAWVENRLIEMENLKTPLLVSEWGESGIPEYGYDLVSYFDDMGANWAQYAYEGNFNEVELDIMVRVYPQRIAGSSPSWSYDPVDREFTLEFDTLQGVDAPTDIYIPETRVFPEGWELSVSDPEGAWSSQWDEDMEILSVFTDPTQEKHVITIEPAE